jgi:PIN domain nuclease of toxin-antitoxin system
MRFFGSLKIRDPFDRLLIATATSEDMTIVTADENIRSYDVRWIW